MNKEKLIINTLSSAISGGLFERNTKITNFWKFYKESFKNRKVLGISDKLIFNPIIVFLMYKQFKKIFVSK